MSLIPPGRSKPSCRSPPSSRSSCPRNVCSLTDAATADAYLVSRGVRGASLCKGYCRLLPGIAGVAGKLRHACAFHNHVHPYTCSDRNRSLSIRSAYYRGQLDHLYRPCPGLLAQLPAGCGVYVRYKQSWGSHFPLEFSIPGADGYQGVVLRG